jgi:hypothetical protein
MNAGALDITAEAEIGAQGVACYSRVSSSSHVRSLTKNFDVEVDSATSLGVFYNLCRSPSYAGHHKPPVRADRAIPFNAWGSYAPLPQEASRSRCGNEGATAAR